MLVKTAILGAEETAIRRFVSCARAAQFNGGGRQLELYDFKSDRTDTRQLPHNEMSMVRIARAYSRYAMNAIVLLGQSIRQGRIAQRLSAQQLAKPVGISRDLLYRVENGDPVCGIGVVFELAAITGVPLFEAEPAKLATRLAASGEKLVLLPKAVRGTRQAEKDDC